jgi:hypothetical protein
MPNFAWCILFLCSIGSIVFCIINFQISQATRQSYYDRIESCQQELKQLQPKTYNKKDISLDSHDVVEFSDNAYFKKQIYITFSKKDMDEQSACNAFFHAPLNPDKKQVQELLLSIYNDYISTDGNCAELSCSNILLHK